MTRLESLILNYVIIPLLPSLLCSHPMALSNMQAQTNNSPFWYYYYYILVCVSM